MAVKKNEGQEMSEADIDAMLAKGKLIMQRLEEVYPEAPKGFLHHSDPFTLLIAVVLSAQSLDVKVNEITPELFRVGGTPAKMRDLGEEKIKQIIRQIGLAPQKAKNIAKLSAMICDEHDGMVPDTFEQLEKLPGVGHKTASVVMMQAFNKPAFPVDTHIHRLACRWGCGDAKSVAKTEERLKQWFPDPTTWADLHVRIILFGREHCPARNHDMDLCPICSFAATVEARTANKQNPTKFVAAKTHKNPYAIREVDPVTVQRKQEEKDDDFAEPKRKDRRRPHVVNKLGHSKTTPVRKATRRAAKRFQLVESAGETDDEDVFEEIWKPLKRRASGGRGAKSMATVAQLESDGPQANGSKPRRRKTRQFVRKEGTASDETNKQELQQGNATGTRASARLRTRRKGQEVDEMG